MTLNLQRGRSDYGRCRRQLRVGGWGRRVQSPASWGWCWARWRRWGFLSRAPVPLGATGQPRRLLVLLVVGLALGVVRAVCVVLGRRSPWGRRLVGNERGSAFTMTGGRVMVRRSLYRVGGTA